jgi:hypothetical protein
MSELSPRQGPPEVDVMLVASIAVVAVVVTHHWLALRLAHRHACLPYTRSLPGVGTQGL